MSSTIIVNTNATNNLLIMNTMEKKKEKEKSSTIQVSDRLKNSLKQMEIDGEGYEDIIWRLILYWDTGHGTHIPTTTMNKDKK